MDNIYHAKLQDKVYYDSFAGMIKAVYVGFSVSSMDIVIKITATKNPTYKYGELLTIHPIHVIPRKCYHSTGQFTYIISPYIFDK